MQPKAIFAIICENGNLCLDDEGSAYVSCHRSILEQDLRAILLLGSDCVCAEHAIVEYRPVVIDGDLKVGFKKL